MWWCLVILVVSSSMTQTDGNQTKSQHGKSVLRITAESKHVPALRSFLQESNYDVWVWQTGKKKDHVDVLVTPWKRTALMSMVEDRQMNHKVIIKDVQRLIDEERDTQVSRRAFDKDVATYSYKYYTYDEINKYLKTLVTKFPETVSLESMGKSYEGRPLTVLRITSSRKPLKARPIIVVDAGIHAREWIASSMALHVINQLVTNVTNRYLVDVADWLIVPVLNPDGYEYTHTKSRLWRKNRRPIRAGCIGVDLNRNYDLFWNTSGANPDPCSLTYAGPSAFSEPETVAFRDYMMTKKELIKLYLTFHSYGNFILYPWGYAHELPKNVKELDCLAKLANAAQMKAGGTKYKIGTSANVLYSAAGGSDDWMMKVGVPLSYTIEMPGFNYGFNLPQTMIENIVIQFFEAVRVFGEYINNGIKKSAGSSNKCQK